MYIFDDNEQMVDAECSVDQFEGLPCIVVESSGGASPTRGIKRRNPDYNELLGLLLSRLAEADTRITRVILDTRRVSGIPLEERVVRVDWPYPIDLRTTDLTQLRRAVQHEVSQMHRDPNATRGGNAQKRIRICLDRPVDPDRLISMAAANQDPDAEISGPGITETERSYLRNARIGQGQFRQDLVRRYGRRCPLTGIEEDLLLIASHIKPWKVCTNAERLDPSNGILLSALVDRLFDKGLISFSADGVALVSPRLSVGDRIKCGIDQWHTIQLNGTSKLYMEYHRSVEFKST